MSPDFDSAIPVSTIDNKSVIKTQTTPDFNSAQPIDPVQSQPKEPGVASKIVKWINDHTTFGRIGQISRQRQIAEDLSASINTMPIEEIQSKQLTTQEGINAEIMRRSDLWDKDIERKGIMASGQEMMTAAAAGGVIFAPGVIAASKVVGGVASYMGLDHFINLRRFAEKHAPQLSSNVLDAIEAVDFVGKASIIGGSFKGLEGLMGKSQVPPEIEAQFKEQTPKMAQTELLNAMNYPKTVNVATHQLEGLQKLTEKPSAQILSATVRLPDKNGNFSDESPELRGTSHEVALNIKAMSKDTSQEGKDFQAGFTVKDAKGEHFVPRQEALEKFGVYSSGDVPGLNEGKVKEFKTESEDALNTLGVEQKHIDVSKSSGMPVNIPLNNLMALKDKPYWDKVKDDWNVDIDILNNKLKELPDKTPLRDRVNLASQYISEMKGKFAKAKTGLQGIKNVGTAVKNWYFNEHLKWDDTESMIRKYIGDRAISRYKTEQFAEQIIRTIPDDAQEGIINWIQAGGDKNLLKDWADKTSDSKLKAGYLKALNFTPEEQELAEMSRKYYETKLQEAQEAGILGYGVQDYVNGIWDRKDIEKSSALKGLIAQADAGLLKTKASFMKNKIFQNYFEGEQEGLKPKDKRIGYTIAAYNQSFDEALAARKFIKDAFEGTASDGRPLVSVSGGGKQLDYTEAESTPWLLKPHAKPEETFDYRYYDHPALRKWKWVGNDNANNSILIEGDVLLHPEFYPRLHALLGKSLVRQNPIGRGLLTAGREVKGTILSLSFFHQVQEGFHGISHAVNPTTLPELNFEKGSLDTELIQHGLMIGQHNALEEFSEGLVGSGLINKLPGIGEYSQKYQGYLFEDYIPRLKMQMGRQAFEKNLKRYPKLSRDQVGRLTADESNFAFGELNWKAMGTNPSMLDAMRIGFLAPDFLLARTGFVGQALRPGGREQLTALIRQGTILYTGTRVLNMLFSKDHDPHWNKPFSVVAGDKEYTIRSVLGDMTHLFRDPRGFFIYRLSPIIGAGMEIGSQRNIYGDKETLGKSIKNVLKRQPPIPLQGLFNKEQDNLWHSILDSVLQSVGISSFKYQTDAEHLAHNIYFDKLPKGALTDAQEKEILTKHHLEEEYKKEDDKSILINAVNSKEITARQMNQIIKEKNMSGLEKSIQDFSVDDIKRIYQVANKDEKKMLDPYLQKKVKRKEKEYKLKNMAKYKKDFKNE